MSLCTICGRWLCDHTAVERHQSKEDMDADLTPEELEAFDSGIEGKKLAAAEKSQKEREEARKRTEKSI